MECKLVRGTKEDPLTIRFGDGTKVTLYREETDAIDDISWFNRGWRWMLAEAFDVVKDALLNALRVLRFKFSV